MTRATSWVLLAPALIVVFWYEVTRNHSQIHQFFTYRNWDMFFAIILAVIALNTFAPRPARWADEPGL